MASVPADPPILDYGTGSAPTGVTIETLPDGMRITFPKPPDPIPRQVARGVGEFFATFLAEFGVYLVPAVFLFGFGMTLKFVRFWAVMILRDALREYPWQFYSFLCICVAAAAIHIGKFVHHRHVTPELELTADALRGRYFQAELAMLVKFSLPRARIHEVKYVSHSGNLVIRAHGREMVEWRPTEDAQTLRFVAARLRQALGLPQPVEPA
jgi:hypothetical protein